MPPLIFVDTNILLDFYRGRGWEGALPLLEQLGRNHPQLVSTCQVEMEFKKNRQSVLSESLRLYRAPDWSSLTAPAFIAEVQMSRQIAGKRKAIDAHVRKIRTRLDKVLRNPSRNDPVFRAAQQLFASDQAHILRREDDAYRAVLEAAKERFSAGYPPRKSGDTSFGDAINWEWVVRCARDRAADIVVVSRDSDYGYVSQNEPILNDWLAEEFKQRVGRRRSIILTDKLADALRRAKITVNRKAAERERSLVDVYRRGGPRRGIEARLAELFKSTVGNADAEAGVDAVLSTLRLTEGKVIRLEYGFDGGRPHELEEIASMMGMSRREVLAVRSAALAKLDRMIA